MGGESKAGSVQRCLHAVFIASFRIHDKKGGEDKARRAEDAGGLTPAKDDNAAMRALYPRAFARISDDCYKTKAKQGSTEYRGALPYVNIAAENLFV